jgi:uncharacterized cupredoxin-like copper-binding protein
MMRRALFPLLCTALAAALVACSSNDAKGAIDVTATNKECKVARTDLAAGKSTFSVKNDGDDVTEVYVYAKGDEVKGEVENIGPGTSRDLTVDLVAGSYQVACKPGMKGDGIRTRITVTGGGGTAAATPTKTVTITAIDYQYEGLADLQLAKGDVVEFRLHNNAPEEKHELEIFGPGDEELGEVGPTEPGATGRVVVTLDRAGTYRVNCGIDDHATKGMTGTFTVS